MCSRAAPRWSFSSSRSCRVCRLSQNRSVGRSSRRASSRLPGGIRRSSRVSAASTMTSFRRAVRSIRGSSFFVRSRDQRRSVMLLPNDQITHRAARWTARRRSPVRRGLTGFRGHERWVPDANVLWPVLACENAGNRANRPEEGHAVGALARLETLRTLDGRDPVLGNVGAEDVGRWRRRAFLHTPGPERHQGFVALPSLIDIDAIRFGGVGRLNEIVASGRPTRLDRDVPHCCEVLVAVGGGNPQVARDDDHRFRLAAPPSGPLSREWRRAEARRDQPTSRIPGQPSRSPRQRSSARSRRM